ncbi:hypothetical protein [Arthrobacter sp. PAMC25564]|uniref:hypothetical protein n=1 Tax=Arthrobacter sp. PAMC25564 TaxID=2565366 RepID=UPI00197B55D5|nr:hypothetical protein [Arthrobacter sp. PAMC25564]
MATVSVRYIVDAAINFYREHLAFTLVMHPAPPFAYAGHAGHGVSNVHNRCCQQVYY